MTLSEKFLSNRARTENICAPLKTEDYIPQAAEFVSPPKWHLAHSSWFFEEMILKKHYPTYKEFHPDFSFLFNSYYNSIGERTLRSNRGSITRPGVEEVYAYRKHIDHYMGQLLETHSNKEVEALTILGINHEQQHQELLLTDLKYTLSCNPTYPMYAEKALLENYNEKNGWLSFNEGIYTIGYDENGFCFDNELGKHRVFLESFRISEALVTNGEFIEFIEEGAYSNPMLWLDEGYSWVKNNNIKSPLYWHKIGEDWFYYTLAGLKKVDKDVILSHISLYEAAAFATYKNCRLPTEFEWEAASDKLGWGTRWEWTNSAYLPYPGFKIKEGALGEYNGKFMVNQMVLRGSSVATSEGHSRKTYRNFFHPQMQWQFSGIRLAK